MKRKVKIQSFPNVNKKLTSNKTYYYKVRAYRTENGKRVYNSYSKVKSVKVK